MPASGQLLGVPIGVLVVVVVLMILLPIVAYVMLQRMGPRARLRTRLAAIADGGKDVKSGGGARAQVKRAKQIKTKIEEAGHAEGAKVSRKVELRLRIERAGLTTPIRTFYIMSVISALVGAAIYLVLGYPPLFAIAVLAVAGIGLPRFVLSHLAKKRQKQFTQHFADAVDVIVRGIKSGLPVGECLNIIARESSEPVRSEFKLLIESQRLGMTLKQALERSCRRMPTADMKFFAIVLNLQQQTGGNLAETLTGLSNVLRSRKRMSDKVKAMSAEARMTAMIIGCMPFVICGVVYLTDPEYISLLWTDPGGKKILFFGLGWMTIGILAMKKMIAFEI